MREELVDLIISSGDNFQINELNEINLLNDIKIFLKNRFFNNNFNNNFNKVSNNKVFINKFSDSDCDSNNYIGTDNFNEIFDKDKCISRGFF